MQRDKWGIFTNLACFEKFGAGFWDDFEHFFPVFLQIKKVIKITSHTKTYITKVHTRKEDNNLVALSRFIDDLAQCLGLSKSLTHANWENSYGTCLTMTDSFSPFNLLDFQIKGGKSTHKTPEKE